MPGPLTSTLKSLFAQSGNRCAFPMCNSPLVLGDTLIGEVCHIKGANPGGPRYDACQNESARHAIENLILLCPPHHKVIDDDQESYTVERLIKMSKDHRSRVKPLGSDEINQAADILISVGQTGGLAANTINAETINIHSTQVAVDQSRDRKIAIGRAQELHSQRVKAITSGDLPVTLLGGALLIIHIVPTLPDGTSIFKSSNDHETAKLFPPIGTRSPMDWTLTYFGLVLGSSNSGLSVPQRAVTLWSTQGYIEAIACYHKTNATTSELVLPTLMAAISESALTYLRSLQHFGGCQPTFVSVSLVNAKGNRLYQDFPNSGWRVESESVIVPSNQCYFGTTIVNRVPQDIAETKTALNDILTRLFNTAGLA